MGRLHDAAYSGNVDELKRLILQGENVNELDEEFEGTPLISACNGGSRNKDAVKFLLDNGANPNIFEKDGYTAMHYAVDNGSEDIVKMLIEYNADVNVMSNIPHVPVETAARKGDVSMVELLVSAGARVIEVKDLQGTRKIHFAAMKGNMVELKNLISLGAEINVKNNLGWTPLHAAAWKGQLEAVKFLIDFGAKPDQLTIDNLTPLQLAMQENNTQIVAVLKKYKVKPIAEEIISEHPSQRIGASSKAEDEKVLYQYNLVGQASWTIWNIFSNRNHPIVFYITDRRLITEIYGKKFSTPLKLINGVEILDFGSNIFLNINMTGDDKEVFRLKEINQDAIMFKDTINSVIC